MKVSIAFSWPAGTWIVTIWIFLWKILSNMWYYVVWDKEYESRIKWWDNLFVLYVSDKWNFISKKIDHFFYFTKYWLEKNESVFDIDRVYEIKKSDCKYQNTYALSMACKTLWIDINMVKKQFEEKFKNKPDVLEWNFFDIEKWYKDTDTNVILKDLWISKVFLHWNEVLAEWAIASWLNWYSAYPMTPASSIIDTVVKHPDKVTFFQWEDEIAVSMSMLWAHFTWKRAMCWTSWWWFALMTESISYANQAELWGVWVLSQRAWPSTWTPTFTEQWDLSFALHASFWDTFPVVIAPSTLEESYNLIWKALNRSDKYQHPVITIVDKQFSESYFAIDENKLKAEEIDRWKIETEIKDEKFARYKVTEDWISNYSIPWTENWTFIASSYEHDIYWATTEDPLTKKIMTDKRAKKMKTLISNEFNEDFYWYEIINPSASKFFVTFGLNSVVLKQFLEENEDFGLIIIKVIQPLDPRLIEFFDNNVEKINELIFVEMNYSWQLEEYVRNKCWLKTPERNNKISHVRKYQSYPFFVEEIK